MCGIAGQFNFSNSPVDSLKLNSMTQALAHRGPDFHDTFLDHNLGLGHRRLSILDLREIAHQPMKSQSGRFVIVWNGECYNYLELRNDLEKSGIKFRTESDTEVVLEGLAHYGSEFLQKANGMFAFALWDRQERKLLIGRDRIGIKPLYYFRDAEKIIFGSEIKAILAAGIEAKAERDSLYWQIRLRYSPGENTVFKEIFKVVPGTVMEFDTTGTCNHKTFWSLTNSAHQELDLTEEDAQEHFTELLLDSVNLRFRSHEKVATFLSGGIDSSSIVATSKKLGFQPETYTMQVPGRLDESKEARLFSESLGLNNHLVQFRENDVDLLPKIINSLEEPICDSIILPTYLLMQHTAQTHKVVLSGEGADEILGGYVHHLALSKINQWKSKFPRWMINSGASILNNTPGWILNQLSPYPSKFGSSAANRLASALSSNTHWEQNLHLMSLFTHEEASRFLRRSQPQPSGNLDKHWSHFKNHLFYSGLISQDLKFWCPDYTLLRVDKLSMSQGLEVRVPFLDHRLVEFCLSLNPSYFISGNQQKRLLAQSMGKTGILSAEKAYRKKSPFIFPMDEMYPNGIPEFLQDTLRSKHFQESDLFNSEAALSILEKPTITALDAKQIFSFYSLETWSKEFSI